MNRLFGMLLLAVLLPGCAVTLHGNQTTGGGATTTTTGSRVQGSQQSGNARIAIASGTAPAPQAGGGQVTFSRGASAVLVAGLVIAGTVEWISDWFRAAAPHADRAPNRNISETCSCYGWQPDPSSEHASQ